MTLGRILFLTYTRGGTVLIILSAGFHGTRLVEEVIKELGYRVDKRPAEEFVNNHF